MKFFLIILLYMPLLALASRNLEIKNFGIGNPDDPISPYVLFSDDPDQEFVPYVNEAQLKAGNMVLAGVQQAKEAALSFCMEAADGEIDCSHINMALFIDLDALELCKEQPVDYHIDCLLFVVNKTYKPSDVDRCRGKGSYKKQRGCLSRNGLAVQHYAKDDDRERIPRFFEPEELPRPELVDYCPPDSGGGGGGLGDDYDGPCFF